jgi:hypothetical protein
MNGRHPRCVAGLALLCLLAACGGTPQSSEPATTVAGAATAGGLCRVGPDGGPVVADRGIGGTGAPTQLADRGIGGTGIIGTITGFASICVDGLEVAYGPATPVSGEAGSSSPEALRVGQVVVVDAVDAGGGLHARRIALRYEVSGPVTRAKGAGRLDVAGQDVLFAPDTPGTALAVGGAWVAVSGFRTPQGAIFATRFDPRMPGTVIVHGQMQTGANGAAIGSLRLAPGLASLPPPGTVAVISGRYAGGTLLVDRVRPDLLATNPAAYFGPDLQHLVVEGYVTGGGSVLIGSGLFGAGGTPLPAGRAILTVDRAAGGGFRTVGAVMAPSGLPRAPAATPAPGPALRFTPAPVPNARAMGGGHGMPREGGEGRPYQQGGSRYRPGPGGFGSTSGPGSGPGPAPGLGGGFGAGASPPGMGPGGGGGGPGPR